MEMIATCHVYVYPYDIQQVEYIIVPYLQYYTKGVQALQPEIRINGGLHFFR